MNLPFLDKKLVYEVDQKDLENIYNVQRKTLVYGFQSRLKNIILRKNKQCYLVITYSHSKKQDSKKKNSPLFRVNAKCKQPGK